MMTPSKLDEAKSRLSIYDLWSAFGLHGSPLRSCCSPFREDRKPSFSISEDGKRFYDFGTGEGGDLTDFVVKAKNCSARDAAHELIRIAGLAGTTFIPKPKAKKILCAPEFLRLTIRDLAEIQHVRGWPVFAGLEIAAQRGLLHRCIKTDDGVPRSAWAITDSARRSIQVRRMDGQLWDWNSAKAWNLRGSSASWPIGAADIGDRPFVFFCEGGPDFLAAHTLAWIAGHIASVAVVCMPGAAASLDTDSLPFFSGKRVRIFEHRDTAGSNAGHRWATQLQQAGATVDGFTFDAPHKDLADLLAATDGESINCPADIFEGLPGEDTSCR